MKGSSGLDEPAVAEDRSGTAAPRFQRRLFVSCRSFRSSACCLSCEIALSCLRNFKPEPTENMSSALSSSQEAGPSTSAASGSGSTSAAHASVLTPSQALPPDSVHVKGPDMSRPLDLQALLESYERTGFQATALGKAVKIVEEMVRLSQICRAGLTGVAATPVRS